jgi:hypothetical protein
VIVVHYPKSPIMRLGFLTLSVFLGCAVASPITSPDLARRDTSVADAYLAKISADLLVLKATLNGLPRGGNQDVANQKALTLLDQLRTLGRTMETATSAVRGGPSIFVMESIGLTGKTNSMSSLVRDVTAGFNTENTKHMIWYAGKREAQYQFADELSRISRAYGNFAGAMIEKLPVLEQGIAGVFKSALGALIDPAVLVSFLLPSTS